MPVAAGAKVGGMETRDCVVSDRLACGRHGDGVRRHEGGAFAKSNGEASRVDSPLEMHSGRIWIWGFRVACRRDVLATAAHDRMTTRRPDVALVWRSWSDRNTGRSKGDRCGTGWVARQPPARVRITYEAKNSGNVIATSTAEFEVAPFSNFDFGNSLQNNQGHPLLHSPLP